MSPVTTAPADGQQSASQSNTQHSADATSPLSTRKLNAQAPDFRPHGFPSNGFSPQMASPPRIPGGFPPFPGMMPPRFGTGPNIMASPVGLHMPPLGQRPAGSPVAYGGYPSFRAAATGQLDPNAPAFIPGLAASIPAATTAASDEDPMSAATAPAAGRVQSPHFDQSKVAGGPEPDFLGGGMGFRPRQAATEPVKAVEVESESQAADSNAEELRALETERKLTNENPEDKSGPEAANRRGEVEAKVYDKKELIPTSGLGADEREIEESSQTDEACEQQPAEVVLSKKAGRIKIESLINQPTNTQSASAAASKFAVDSKFDKFAKYRKTAEQPPRPAPAFGSAPFGTAWRASTKFADVLADLDQKTIDAKELDIPTHSTETVSGLGGPIEAESNETVSPFDEPPVEIPVTYTRSGKRSYAISDLWAVRDAPRCTRIPPEFKTGPMAGVIKGSQSGSRSSPTSVEELYRSGARTAAMAGDRLRIPTLMRNSGGGGSEEFVRRRDGVFSRSAGMSNESDFMQRTASVAPIIVPEDSWQAKQRTEKEQGSDTVKKMRKLRAQLNKMAPATYEQLYENIASQGLASSEELEQLVTLIFEKAITNHQYIVMYAELCGDLQKSWDAKTGEDGKGFRRVLLNCCQDCFKNNLQHDFVPSEGLDDEEAFEELLLHKKKMKGNLMFVGALAQQQLLGARVLVMIMKSLLETRRPLQLEALAAFLPSATVQLYPNNKFRNELEAIFEQVEHASADSEVEMRIQCLLRDAIDHRNQILRVNLPRAHYNSTRAFS